MGVNGSMDFGICLKFVFFFLCAEMGIYTKMGI